MKCNVRPADWPTRYEPGAKVALVNVISGDGPGAGVGLGVGAITTRLASCDDPGVMFVPVMTASTVFVPDADEPMVKDRVPDPPEITRVPGIALPKEPVRPPVVLFNVVVIDTV